MKKLTTAINYLLVQPDELPPAEQALVQKAIDATNNSYARYSNFHVGAACLLENGNVVIVANQENAAFPSGLCAERTAIFATGQSSRSAYHNPCHSRKKCQWIAEVAHITLRCLPTSSTRDRRPLPATCTHLAIRHRGHLCV